VVVTVLADPSTARRPRVEAHSCGHFLGAALPKCLAVLGERSHSPSAVEGDRPQPDRPGWGRLHADVPVFVIDENACRMLASTTTSMMFRLA
jgi:hypothetical protein